MSGSKIVYLHCDGECDDVWNNAPNPTFYGIVDAPGDTLAEQRAAASKAGWKTGLSGGRDLCPDCARTVRGSD